MTRFQGVWQRLSLGCYCQSRLHFSRTQSRARNPSPERGSKIVVEIFSELTTQT